MPAQRAGHQSLTWRSQAQCLGSDSGFRRTVAAGAATCRSTAQQPAGVRDCSSDKVTQTGRDGSRLAMVGGLAGGPPGRESGTKEMGSAALITASRRTELVNLAAAEADIAII